MFKSWIAAAVALTMAAAPVAACAGEAMPNADKLALARRYIEVMQVDMTLDSLMASLGPISARGVIRNLELPPNSRKARLLETAFGEVMAETVAALLPRYVEQMSEIYARTYTDAELMGLIEFYSSPVGRSVLEKTPGLAPEASRAMEKLLPQIDFEFQRRLCRRVGCAPSARAAIL